MQYDKLLNRTLTQLPPSGIRIRLQAELGQRQCTTIWRIEGIWTQLNAGRSSFPAFSPVAY